MTSQSEKRLALIGAHLRSEDTAVVPAVQTIHVEGLFVSAYSFDARAGIADSSLIAEVTKARGALIQQEIFVAIRYGVSVSDPNETADKIRPHLERWTGLLTDYRGYVEMTLKIASQENAARPDRHQFQSGADYLRELHRTRSAKSLEPEVSEMLEKNLFPIALQTRWVDRQDAGIELAFLMHRSELEALGEIAQRIKSRFPKLPFMLSGPWPLEIFANDE